MFGFLSKPQQVELLEVDDRRLTFRARKPLTVGNVVKVRVVVPGVDMPENSKLTLPVSIVTSRGDAEEGFICTGDVPKHLELEEFQEQLRQFRALEPRARRSSRYRVGLRILSPELPAFRAISVDLSLHGLQIEAQGTVELGTVMTLTLELDAPEIATSLITRAQVVWCTPSAQRTARVGLEFLELDPKLRKQLERFEELLDARAEGRGFGERPSPGAAKKN